MNTKDEKNELEPKQYPAYTKKPNQEYNADCSTKKQPNFWITLVQWLCVALVNAVLGITRPTGTTFYQFNFRPIQIIIGQTTILVQHIQQQHLLYLKEAAVYKASYIST